MCAELSEEYAAFFISVGAGIAQSVYLDGPEIDFRVGEIFRTLPHGLWGPSSLLYNVYRVSFLGLNWPSSGVDHTPPSSVVVEERVELYLYSPSGPSWHVTM
jgi:hypothetical protein